MAQQAIRTLLLVLLLVSTGSGDVYPAEMSSAQSRQPEYTHGEPYLLPIGAPDVRGKQTGDTLIELLASDRLHPSRPEADPWIGRAVLGTDPPVIPHLVFTQLTASGL